MKSRIFIGINISEKIKRRLIENTEKWRDLPVKWVPEANLHITLAFLGWVYDDLLPDICEKVKKAAKNKEIIELEFEKIALAPENSISPLRRSFSKTNWQTGKKPNMLWLWGKTNSELLKLVQDLEKELDISNTSRKTFRPHITLGRIQAKKWEALNPAPEINEKHSLIIPAESIDIMASRFIKGNNKYAILESCPLG